MGTYLTSWARLLLACCFALCVAGVVIYVVPGGFGGYNLVFAQDQTRLRITSTSREIDDFRAKHGHLPATLDNLDVVWKDGWGHPLLYSRSNGNALIESLGRDGARGGVGLDADLSNQNLRPAAARVPLLQKLQLPLAQQMIVVALLCSVMAGVSVYKVLKDQSWPPQSWLSFGSTLIVAFGMAVFGAIFITAMHVPTGH